MDSDKRKQQKIEYYYRQQEKKGKTPVKGRYGILKHMTPEEHKAYRALQQKAWQQRTKDTKSAEYIEKRKAYQRKLYHRRKAEGYVAPVKYTSEELKERKRELYLKRKSGITRKLKQHDTEQMNKEIKKIAKKAMSRKSPKPLTDKRKEQIRENKRLAYIKKVEAEGKEYIPRSVRMSKPKREPKPVRVVPVKTPRKAKPPQEPKTKPEVMPTLVRDESNYVSVRIDARTVIRVPPGKDAEQVKQRYIARMLQNSKI